MVYCISNEFSDLFLLVGNYFLKFLEYLNIELGFGKYMFYLLMDEMSLYINKWMDKDKVVKNYSERIFVFDSMDEFGVYCIVWNLLGIEI